ncbi:MAG TPA: urease accessory protein UreE [Candidatus Binataceae bacterium]|nr:urease accessory protein UreE [Candidatus Binataceae bacterium]
MLLIESLPGPNACRMLAHRERDTIMMTFEERRWLRRRTNTASGRAIALALPTGTRLSPGAIIAVEPDWYLQVEAAPEPVLAVDPESSESAIRVAFEVGNHHFPLALNGTRILVPDDTAMTQLLTRLGVRWERCHAVFDPIGHGHSHDD